MNLKTLFCSSEKAKRINPLYLIGGHFLSLYLIIGFILRIVLMAFSPADATYTVMGILRGLTVGLLSDFGMGLLLLIPLFVFYIGLNEYKYKKYAAFSICLLLIAGLAYAFWPGSIFRQYGGGAPRIAQIFLGWKLLSFSLRAFIPRIRKAWRACTLYLTWGIYILLLLVVSAGEFFFWEEFGVRYNFIAVDYLVYTHEVIGNIMESYSIVPLIAVLLLITLGLILVVVRKRRFQLDGNYNLRRFGFETLLAVVLVGAGFGATSLTHNLDANNQYVTQIEQNGAYDFVRAFLNNKLEYDKFYTMLPPAQCEALYRQQTGLDANGTKQLSDGQGAEKCNIVLITVESLSADFLTRYGNKEGLTPNIDRLMTQSLVFDSLYACGNRTVRGLEALSLCIPPHAGESVIKQKNNRMGTLSVGYQLSKLGYTTQFLYGGYSYFDNMGDYFSHNGYEVIDRSNIAKQNITFANIWGVCDEDIFNKGLEVFDSDAKTGKPFFAQFMTTSNHRPYTYPTEKIHVEGNPYTRNAAVKYTDYAIGDFLNKAAKKPWFKNTVFIIIADHCASSAGKTSLPLEKYHIPCLIFSPGRIQPQIVSKVCSQIDILPTLFSILHLPAKVSFAGNDILSPNFKERAFLATYQDLGYYENHIFTVLSPVRKVQQYAIRPNPDGTFEETLLKKQNIELTQKAVSFYQTVNK